MGIDMRGLLIFGVVAALLGACSKSQTACYGLSDGDLVDKVVHDYEAQPASAKGDTAQMALSRARVLGIGRSADAKESGKAVTQVWFSQDDRTLTVAALLEDCTLSFRPNLAPDAIKQAAYPAAAPHF
jgi:Flp pilus assembly protein CpaB